MLLRPSILGLAVLCSLVVSSQAPMQYHYVARIDGMVNRMTMKQVFEALVELEPDGAFDPDTSAQQLQLRVSAPLTAESLQAAMDPFGFHVSQFTETTPTNLATELGGMPGLPAIGKSDNPAADNATYETLKAQWIATDPKAYQIGIEP